MYTACGSCEIRKHHKHRWKSEKYLMLLYMFLNIIENLKNIWWRSFRYSYMFLKIFKIFDAALDMFDIILMKWKIIEQRKKLDLLYLSLPCCRKVESPEIIQRIFITVRSVIHLLYEGIENTFLLQVFTLLCARSGGEQPSCFSNRSATSCIIHNNQLILEKLWDKQSRCFSNISVTYT